VKLLRESVMKNYKVIALATVLSFSFLAQANESEAVVVEASMENVLEVGRENQQLSAASQSRIDSTERQNRIDLVRASLAKPKVTASEQVRQVLEAYNIEAEYGRKIDSYEATVEGKVVNILVVGRIGMFYQTKDETETGVWNNDSQSWEIIDGYRRPVRDGIRMAKKLAPTDMLTIPVLKGGA